jgi:hypothetical protein
MTRQDSTPTTEDPHIVGFSVPPARDPQQDEDIMVVMLDAPPSPAWIQLFHAQAQALITQLGLRDIRVVGRRINAVGTIAHLRRTPPNFQGLVKEVSFARRAALNKAWRKQVANAIGPRSSPDPREIEIERMERVPGIAGILESVLALTKLRFAAVARVTETRWTALVVIDRVGFGVVPGQDMILEQTLCNEVRQLRQVVAFSHASADPRYGAHPLPALYGFESHLSVPIYLSDGALFGTLCALDPEPTPITDEMIGVVLALAAQIGSALSADGAVQAPLDPVGDDGRLESA